MKLSFLIQLILLLLLVLSLYMVFTNNVMGRMKLILIIFCVVIGVYLFSKLKVFNNYDEFYSTPTNGRSINQSFTIDKDALKKSDGHFAISVWMFIDDWNYKYGEKKHILKKKVNSTLSLPHMYLDEYKNDLYIDVDMMSKDAESYQKLLTDTLNNAGVQVDDTMTYNCQDDLIYDSSDIMVLDGSQNRVNCPNGSKQTIKIENINMQKWVNVITTINNRTLDVYINGKLVKTKTFDNVIDPIVLNSGGIDLVPNGGFGGYFSKVQYYPYFINPEKAWTIYRSGFGDAFESSLERYNMALSFYKDSVEQNKMYLF